MYKINSMNAKKETFLPFWFGNIPVQKFAKEKNK